MITTYRELNDPASDVMREGVGLDMWRLATSMIAELI